jgi:hypothetical protein
MSITIHDCEWWDDSKTDYQKKCYLEQIYQYLDLIKEKWPREEPIFLISLGSGKYPLPEICLLNALKRLGYDVALYLVDSIYPSLLKNHTIGSGLYQDPQVPKDFSSEFSYYHSLSEIIPIFEESNYRNILMIGFNAQYITYPEIIERDFEYKTNVYNEILAAIQVLQRSYDKFGVKHLNFTTTDKCVTNNWLDFFQEKADKIWKK